MEVEKKLTCENCQQLEKGDLLDTSPIPNHHEGGDNLVVLRVTTPGGTESTLNTPETEDDEISFEVAPEIMTSDVRAFSTRGTKRPKFDFVYDEFERKKRAIESVAPTTETILAEFLPLEAPYYKSEPVISLSSHQIGEYALFGTMNEFMRTYAHGSTPPNFAPGNDWTRETHALLDELQSYKVEPTSPSSIWPCKMQRKISGESGFGSDTSEERQGEQSWSSFKTETLNSNSDGEYEAGIDEAFAPARKNEFGPIGGRRFTKPELKIRTASIDSGYYSAADRGSWSSTVEIDDIVGLNYTTSPVFRSKKPSSIEDPLSPIKLDPLATPFLCKPWNGASRRQQGKQSFNSSHNISTAPSSSLKISSDNGYPRHKKWITKEILEMIAVRDKLYRSMKNQPSPELVSMYKKVRNMVVGMTRNAKRMYEKKIHDSRRYSYRSRFNGSNIERFYR